jgi:hypothetical protein
MLVVLPTMAKQCRRERNDFSWAVESRPDTCWDTGTFTGGAWKRRGLLPREILMGPILVVTGEV